MSNQRIQMVKLSRRVSVDFDRRRRTRRISEPSQMMETIRNVIPMFIPETSLAGSSATNVQAPRKAAHNAVVFLGKEERGLERALLG
jgi:hypothetical protein